MIRVVAGLLQRENRFLIAERPANKPYAGYWELPGGKIEKNETSFAALVREMKEEVGIEVRNAHCLLQHEHQYPDKLIHIEVWQINDFQGEPVSLEQQTLNWATLTEIRAINMLAGNVQLMDKLQHLIEC